MVYLSQTTRENNVMGEWSDYFEDYPEEDMGNYVNGRFDPELARKRNMQKYEPSVSDREKKLRQEQQELLLKHKGIK
ncbi:hypothetical protein RMB13_07130 [Acinetobacter sp. V102_4]|uniref:hypothetical protein n=1 Tax=Acinetobacter sp. V102_4 TaxID=3072984 RepID=UPI00287BF0C2|nr:hypothetical protein [Acinetobacter sp. V102_4]MDS7929250.1 hypothetical protein [Acinetobacter sp. V102_4]